MDDLRSRDGQRLNQSSHTHALVNRLLPFEYILHKSSSRCGFETTIMGAIVSSPVNWIPIIVPAAHHTVISFSRTYLPQCTYRVRAAQYGQQRGSLHTIFNCGLAGGLTSAKVRGIASRAINSRHKGRELLRPHAVSPTSYSVNGFINVKGA